MPLASRTFSQLIDFTRTSAATYVNSAGNIVSTPASVNLLTHTQEFANAAWTKTDTTVTANNALSPDGIMTADTLAEGSAGTGQVGGTGSVSSAGATATFSIYLKRGNTDWVRLQVLNGANGFRAWFNLNTGAVGTSAAVGTGTLTGASIVNAGNGWYRCILTGAIPAVTAYSVFSNTASADNSATRVSSGTYLAWGAQLEQASSATSYIRNFGGLFTARFNYDPITLAPRGLLVEEQRTNLITYSEEFDNAAWTKSQVSVTANAATSPDGTVDADKIVPNTTNAVHGAYRTQTYGAGTFTFSFYAKADGYPRVGTRSYDGTSYFMQATFDISAGTVVSAIGGTASIQAAGNGWYRCAVTATTAGNMGATVGTWIEPLPAGQLVQASYAGDGTSGTLVWGVQNEAGSFATSYIPTVASQTTRSADQAVIQAPNFAPWYNTSEGTFIVEYDLILATYGTTKHLATASDGTGNNRISIYNAATTATPFLIVTDAGVTQASAANTAVGSGATIKTGVAYRANDFAIITNSGTAATDTSGTVPTALDRLYIGGSATGAQPVNGHIRSIRYYPSRLTNAQIQGLTA